MTMQGQNIMGLSGTFLVIALRSTKMKNLGVCAQLINDKFALIL